ncbi:hypothetical protein Bp8pC_091 [Bacillus phage Bp8p-C]|uniref:Uncharacterized protein n=2 Tax=Agatevirus Bp8pC TaxID=1910937 RepID=A0A0A0PLK6_9CAUD|nr:anti-sigma factor [Bacillus phage Bp8p-C]YP_009784392.1 hypothetical protein QLX39_gp091 [Bacillus phage Bp8p-T]AHJ87522.1 hypothetical protein Bp8pC_091 [Bacillus phage Bp8p-C]AHJ87733.1 hypothetical protein Bp8pT_091 [Bacillus phage Bp8p-T]
MKLTRKDKDTFIMTVETTEGGTKDLAVGVYDLDKIYPFNSNYMYKYSPTRDAFYLCKDRKYKNVDVYQHAEGDNDISYFADVYGTEEQIHVEYPFQAHVSNRNSIVQLKARKMGIPVMWELISKTVTKNDIKAGHRKLADAIDKLNEKIEKRYLDSISAEEVLEDRRTPNSGDEDWYAAIYTVATPEEEHEFIMYGEIYTMLRLLRRIIEVK